MNILTITKLALRNCQRNGRRALLASSVVALGVLGFSLLEGYFTNVYRILEDQAVVGERLGHLVITKVGFFEHGAQDPEEYAFAPDELEVVATELENVKNIDLVSQRLSVSGLVSNGESSRIFFGEAIEPGDLVALRGKEYADLPGRLNAEDTYCASFGSKLAEYLGVKAGGDATVLTSTIGGMVNALDVKACEVANTGSTATDDKFILLSLPFARRLLAFKGADRISVRLSNSTQMDTTRATIISSLSGKGLRVEVKTWQEVSQYYGQVKGMFDMMNGFFAIVLTLVVVAIMTNTLAMSISERVREIGTMRAFGMLPSKINRMFLVEGALIAGFGGVLGSVAAAILGLVINRAEITYTPPDASAEAVLALDILAGNLVGTIFTLVVLGALSAYFIARRASNGNVVEALAHV